MPLVPSEYCHGTLVDDRPGRPDPTSEERATARRANRIGYRALLAERKWTAEQFATAQLYNFPKPAGQVLHRDGGAEAMYSKTAVDEWARALKVFVAKSLK